MRKSVIFALAALLLCGTLACGLIAPANEPAQTPTLQPIPIGDVAAAMAKAAESTASPQPTEAPLTPEELNSLPPLSIAEYPDTHWHAQNYNCISIFDDFVILYTENEVLWLTASGDGYLVETRLYRTPEDTEPALVLPAGEIRVLFDGEALRIQVLDDPLGILSHAKVDGQPYKKQNYAPKRYTNWNFWNAPEQPQTDWDGWMQRTDGTYFDLQLHIGDDLSITGTLDLRDGTVLPCTLLCGDYSYALVTEQGGTAELLIYAEWDMEEDDTWRNDLAKQEFEVLIDTIGFSDSHIRLWRDDTYEPTDMHYMCGVNLDTVILNLIRDGWTERPITELDKDLDGWFAWLTKDGESILLYYEVDFPAYGDEYFLIAYIRYGADGTVLNWSGERPVDHAIADAYKLEKGVYFEDSVWGGMQIHEDGYVYFLDDGRIAIEWVPHEGGGGDLEFRIVKAIP